MGHLSDYFGSNANMSAVPHEVRLLAVVGAVAAEGALLDDTLTSVVTYFLSASPNTRAALEAFAVRREKVAKRHFAQKVELLELVWPHRWTSPKPLLARLRQAGNRRNELAHAYPELNVMQLLVDSNGEPARLDHEAYWSLVSTRAQRGTEFADVESIADSAAQIGELSAALRALLFASALRDVPMNAEWVLTHHWRYTHPSASQLGLKR